MVDGVRDRRGVDDRVVAADERVRAAGVGEVGLEVATPPVAGPSKAGGVRSVAVTRWPARRTASTVAAPTFPRAPVTRMRIRLSYPVRPPAPPPPRGAAGVTARRAGRAARPVA